MATSPRSLIDLDHPMLKVRDLAAARAAYERLGFKVTPYRTNDPMGGGTTGGKGGNHLVMLTPQTPLTTNMLELAYCDEAHAWPALRELLGGPQGLALLVHSPTDAHKIYAEWTEAGIECEPVFEVKTNFVDPETGRKDVIHFRVAQPKGIEWTYPFGAAQIMDFDHYLRADWLTHDNGALYWSALQLIVADEQALQEGLVHLRKVYGVEPEREAEGIVRVRIEKLTLRVMTRAAAAQAYPGISLDTADGPCHTALTIKVRELSRVRDLLKERGVPMHDRGDSIVVPPQEVCGVMMEFSEV